MIHRLWSNVLQHSLQDQYQAQRPSRVKRKLLKAILKFFPLFQSRKMCIFTQNLSAREAGPLIITSIWQKFSTKMQKNRKLNSEGRFGRTLYLYTSSSAQSVFSTFKSALHKMNKTPKCTGTGGQTWEQQAEIVNRLGTSLLRPFRFFLLLLSHILLGLYQR